MSVTSVVVGIYVAFGSQIERPQPVCSRPSTGGLERQVMAVPGRT